MIRNRIKVIFIFLLLIFIISNNLSANFTIKNYESNNIFGFEVFNDATVNISGDEFYFIAIPSIQGLNYSIQLLPSCMFAIIICINNVIMINNQLWEETADGATILAVRNLGIDSYSGLRSATEIDLAFCDILEFNEIEFFGATIIVKNIEKK